ncbi:peptide cleavage/export ABC transporter [Staphylococcus pseudintermedius]|nr:peptide cleavage/export ABC transporter [Staphylococcus pseudintermedius]ELK4158885.1 peptide cleavage/export ABC transporter [Staphylococcus pseudintermedius]
MRCDKKYIYIADPVVNLTKMTYREFKEEWTGVTILLKPTSLYKPIKQDKVRLTSFIPLLLKEKRFIIKIIIISILVNMINILGSYFMKSIIDFYIPQKLKTWVSMISMALIASYIMQQILSYLQKYFLILLVKTYSINILSPYIKHLFRLPITFFETGRAGDILSRLNDANSITDALASTMLSLFLDVTIIVGISIFLYYQSTILFVLILIIIPIYAVIVFGFMNSFERKRIKSMEANATLSSYLMENITGMETIKALTCEKKCYKQIKYNFSNYYEKTFLLNKLNIKQNVLKKVVQLILNVSILWVGANLVIDNQISIGTLLVFNSLMIYFMNPIENIMNLQLKLQIAGVANNRLNEIFTVKSEFEKNKLDIKLNQNSSKLIFSNISYGYGYEKEILTDINITIEHNSKVAFIGESGSGKTTLAKMMVSFFEPSKGKITLGGLDITNINKSVLRQQIIYIPQQTYIFNGTILENLLLGVVKEVTQKDIDSAIKMAELKSFIDSLPLGLDSVLSSDFSALSGGQRQKIALARALLTNSSILIMDEATSNIDILTERKIINNLMALNKTIIFISHNLNITQKVDKIFVLAKGKIIEEGSHEFLLKAKGYYSNLIN